MRSAPETLITISGSTVLFRGRGINWVWSLINNITAVLCNNSVYSCLHSHRTRLWSPGVDCSPGVDYSTENCVSSHIDIFGYLTSAWKLTRTKKSSMNPFHFPLHLSSPHWHHSVERCPCKKDKSTERHTWKTALGAGTNWLLCQSDVSRASVPLDSKDLWQTRREEVGRAGVTRVADIV